MTEAQNSGLYGNSDQIAKSKAPSLMDQILGVFTEPGALFDRLRKAPSWAPAVVLTTVFALVVSIAWLTKVDLDAMLRPILERVPNIPAERLDAAVEMQKKFIPVFAIGGSLLFPICVSALLAFVYWMMGKQAKGFFILAGIFIGLELLMWGLSHLGPQPRAFMPISGTIMLLGGLWLQFSKTSALEDTAPSYLQALSAAVVPGLVMIPHSVLAVVMALAKPVGGLTPERLTPTSVGYFVEVASIKGQAALYAMDLFTFALLGISYLSFRRTLKFRPASAIVATLILAAFVIGGQISRAQ